MRVLVVGVTGLIGSAIAARLSTLGHAIIGASRGTPKPGLVPMTYVSIDVAHAIDPADWLPHLVGTDAVVNCAGVFQDSPRDWTEGVHAKGAAALFAACVRASVRRVVHISAVGIERDAPTPFSRSKLAGDRALMALDLDWIILRPSVVWMQMRMRDLAAQATHESTPLPPEYHRMFWMWFAFGFPAFASVLGIFWLMIARPSIALG